MKKLSKRKKIVAWVTLLVFLSPMAIVGVNELFKYILEKQERNRRLEIAEELMELAAESAKYCLDDKNEECERFAKKTVLLLESTFGEDSVQVLNGLILLVAAYNDQGKYQDAEKVSWRALEIDDRNFGLKNQVLGDALYSIAEHHINDGRYKQAESLLDKLLEHSKQRLEAEYIVGETQSEKIGYLSRNVEQMASAMKTNRSYHQKLIQDIEASQKEIRKRKGIGGE